MTTKQKMERTVRALSVCGQYDARLSARELEHLVDEMLQQGWSYVKHSVDRVGEHKGLVVVVFERPSKLREKVDVDVPC